MRKKTAKVHKRLSAVLSALCALLLLAMLCGCSPSSTSDLTVNNDNTAVDPAADRHQETPDHTVRSDDRTSGKDGQSPDNKDQTTAATAEITVDFGLRLFKKCYKEGKNTLISPLSVWSALVMTANGAKSDTLSQVESVLGMPLDKLNDYYKKYADSLPQKNSGRVDIANSVWVSEDAWFKLNDAFIGTAKRTFGAEINTIPFDSFAVKQINNWVSRKTDGMIPSIVDEIPSDTLMYLINALTFEGKWEKPYYSYQVHENTFTCADGSEKTTTFMYGEEWQYIQTDLSSGFIKYYEDRNYAFAVLLPNEGTALSELIGSLDGKTLLTALSDIQQADVHTSLPKFSLDYDAELSNILYAMGIKDLFSASDADLSGMVSGEEGILFISEVLHKTHIDVNELGTKAAAVTAEPAAGAAPDFKEVHLNRPFLYMLIDCKTNIPFFIGAFEDIPEN